MVCSNFFVVKLFSEWVYLLQIAMVGWKVKAGLNEIEDGYGYEHS